MSAIPTILSPANSYRPKGSVRSPPMSAAIRSARAGTVRFRAMPIADPERITDELVRAVKTQKASYVAVHVNHPRELSHAAQRACARLIDAGIPLLSQSVLLKGVNDDVATLEALMRALVEARIQPYYLHHLDRAPGTSHFRVDIAEGQRLMRELRASASGLCQPHYGLDIPEGYAKALLNLSDIEQTGDSHRVRDATGRWHPYP